jgi:hypothetical protein
VDKAKIKSESQAAFIRYESGNPRLSQIYQYILDKAECKSCFLAVKPSTDKPCTGTLSLENTVESL